MAVSEAVSEAAKGVVSVAVSEAARGAVRGVAKAAATVGVMAQEKVGAMVEGVALEAGATVVAWEEEVVQAVKVVLLPLPPDRPLTVRQLCKTTYETSPPCPLEYCKARSQVEEGTASKNCVQRGRNPPNLRGCSGHEIDCHRYVPVQRSSGGRATVPPRRIDAK